MAVRQILPEDLMIQILVCLPVKSIVRFKCVSKTWCNMLKSPNFINSHLLSQRRMNVLLVRRCLIPPENDDVLSFHDPDSPELEEVCSNLSIPFLKDIYNKYDKPYLGPCNGIVCIFHYDFVILCNPALREFKALPPCPFACPQGLFFYIMGRGFGNTSTNDFKVVLLQMVNPKEYNNPQVKVNLYSVSTGSWKQIDGGGENDPVQVGHVSGLPYTELFFNGACHWSASHPNMKGAILSFDLSTEVSGWLEYPDISTRRFECWSSFMVINECLAVVWHNVWEKEPIDIWVMKEYGVRESWIKQFVVGPLLDNNFGPFLLWKNEWLLLYKLNEDCNDQLVSYSFHTDEIKKYQVYGKKRTLSALIYQESLVSLDHE